MIDIKEIREVTREEFLQLVKDFHRVGSSIENVILSNMTLSNLDLSGISMEGCIFRSCVLTDMNFKESNLHSCSFHKTNMENVDFTGANLLECKITYLKMNNVKFVGSKFPQALFNNVDFSNVDFSNAIFTNVGFTNAVLFHDCNFHDCEFFGVKTKFPLSMSSRQDILTFCNDDCWHAGCFKGSTSELIEKLEANKHGLQLIAYLSNMLMYANEPTMTNEMRSQIMEALQRAASKMQGG
jgi:uncharacterized protein YjbI with pentapeptide repeats